MSEQIKPALSADEWNRPLDQWGQRLFWFDGTDVLVKTNSDGTIAVNWDGGVYEQRPAPLTETSRHAVAALLLYAQPFGFSREDVRRLRQYARFTVETDDILAREVFAANLAWFDSLADRIESHLPPETS